MILQKYEKSHTDSRIVYRNSSPTKHSKLQTFGQIAKTIFHLLMVRFVQVEYTGGIFSEFWQIDVLGFSEKKKNIVYLEMKIVQHNHINHAVPSDCCRNYIRRKYTLFFREYTLVKTLDGETSTLI